MISRRALPSGMLCAFLVACSFDGVNDPYVEGRLDPGCESALTLKDIENDKVATLGVGFLVYPEAMPARYTGCQVMWLENGHKLATTHYENGEATWIRGQEPKDVRPFFCLYENGRLVQAQSFNVK